MVEAVDLVAQLLVSKRKMLEDYFSVEISAEGALHAIPLVVDNHQPSMRKLPNFLLTLGHDTEWESEKACFMSVAEAIADFYSVEMSHVPNHRDPGLVSKGEGAEAEAEDAGEDAGLDQVLRGEEHVIQHVIFPALRTQLKPSTKRATDATIVQVASLEKLYKIFERC